VGTSKKTRGGGSAVSLKGCGTSVALATGPNDEEEVVSIMPCLLYPQVKSSHTFLSGVLVDTRGSLDVLQKRKISCP